MTGWKQWATSDDGSIEYISLTKDLLEPAIRTMQQSFYINENICMAFNMSNQPESFPEMDMLLLRAAKDGVSIVARDKATGKVAGAAFNKLEESSDTLDFYQNHINSCQYSASRGVTQWMVEIEAAFNIFNHCKVNTVMEIMFVGTSPEFRKRGIAKKLFEVSIDLARRLKHGQNIKVPIDVTPLKLGTAPEGVTAICTSFITQKIARDLYFKPAGEIPFDKFKRDGKSLASIITNTPFITYEYIKI